MTTHKIHDIASLKALIKANAAQTRAVRDEARTLTGMARWQKQRGAEYNAVSQRYLLLAYGYLRGKTISQVESLFSDPDEIPSAEGILDIAQGVFNKGPDGVRKDPTPEKEPTTWEKFKKVIGAADPDMIPKDGVDKMDGWEDFATAVRKDIAAWTSKIRTNHTLQAAKQRVA